MDAKLFGSIAYTVATVVLAVAAAKVAAAKVAPPIVVGDGVADFPVHSTEASSERCRTNRSFFAMQPRHTAALAAKHSPIKCLKVCIF